MQSEVIRAINAEDSPCAFKPGAQSAFPSPAARAGPLGVHGRYRRWWRSWQAAVLLLLVVLLLLLVVLLVVVAVVVFGGGGGGGGDAWPRRLGRWTGCGGRSSWPSMRPRASG